MIQEETGRLCPRVELTAGNMEAAMVLQLCIDDHKRPMVSPFLFALLGRLPGHEIEKIIRRASAALVGNERITEHLYPKFDKEGK